MVASNYSDYTSKSNVYSVGITTLALAIGLKPPISKPSRSLNWLVNLRKLGMGGLRGFCIVLREIV